MKEKLIRYAQSWSFMRFVRLALGVIIMVQGIFAGETLSMLLGGAFAGMALANVGCNGACAINTIGTNKKDEGDFEEVVVKK